MKTILTLLSLILVLGACNSNDKMQLRAPQNETLESKPGLATDTSKIDTTVSQKALAH